MNQAQLFSIIRQILLVAGGTFVSKGWIDSGMLDNVVGALLIIVGAGWALYERRRSGIVESAAALPEVRTIVADPAVAAVASSGKVVVAREG